MGEDTIETDEKTAKTKVKAKKTKTKAKKTEASVVKKKRGWPKGKKRGPRKGFKRGRFTITKFVSTLKRVEATRNKLARLEKELKQMAKKAAG